MSLIPYLCDGVGYTWNQEYDIFTDMCEYTQHSIFIDGKSKEKNGCRTGEYHCAQILCDSLYP